MMIRYMPDGWVVPAVEPLTAPFFTTGKLMLQRCKSCDAVQHPPEDICIQCQSFELDYIQAAGTGVIASYTIAYHPVHPLLQPKTPYNIILVQLDDYPHIRIVGNLLDSEIEDVKIGAPVRAIWEEIPDDRQQLIIKLPQWVKA